MNKFQIISKHWPSGDLLDGGIDDNPVSPGGAPFYRTAAALAPGPGAPNGYRFLFWNTGRRVTNKYKVSWTFNNLASWTTWTATRWYGASGGGSGGGSGAKLITTAAFAMEDDARLSESPIDGVNSTFTNGSAGELAYIAPAHTASTKWGPASVSALNPLPPAVVFKTYHFAGWLRLILGGDVSGQFDESDGAAVGGGSAGGPDAYLTANPVSVAQNDSIDLMAAYRVVRVRAPIKQVVDGPKMTFIEWALEYERLVNRKGGAWGPNASFGDPFDARIGALVDLFEIAAASASTRRVETEGEPQEAAPSTGRE